MRVESPLIDGQWIEPESGATFEVRAKNGDGVARCHRTDAADAGRAVAADAFGGNTPATDRGATLSEASTLLVDHTDELTGLLCREEGTETLRRTPTGNRTTRRWTSTRRRRRCV